MVWVPLATDVARAVGVAAGVTLAAGLGTAVPVVLGVAAAVGVAVGGTGVAVGLGVELDPHPARNISGMTTNAARERVMSILPRFQPMLYTSSVYAEVFNQAKNSGHRSEDGWPEGEKKKRCDLHRSIAGLD
jgi:hypothetical protein